MKIIQIPVGSMANFAYLIGDEITKKAAIIDPGFETEKIIKIAEENNFKITKILLTHFHFDHSGEAEKIAKKTGAKIYGHYLAKEKNKINPLGFWKIPKIFLPLKNKDEIVIGNMKGQAISTPGHQNDHLCFLFENNIFTGDALFIDGIGRTDLPDSDPAKMNETLKFFKSLPDDVLVYPGHDYGSVPFRTIGQEKQKNSFLKTF